MVNFGNRARGWVAYLGDSYYEQIGILLPARRVSGQRRYDETVLYRLAVVRRAQEVGLALHEIRQLFFGFGPIHFDFSSDGEKIAERKNAGVGCQDQTDPKHA